MQKFARTDRHIAKEDIHEVCYTMAIIPASFICTQENGQDFAMVGRPNVPKQPGNFNTLTGLSLMR